MDPIANIKRQRELVREIREQIAIGGVFEEAAGELADLVEALDEWRTSGGFDPYAPARVHVVIWNDGYGVNANAYATREAAGADFDNLDDGEIDPILLDITVQS